MFAKLIVTALCIAFVAAGNATPEPKMNVSEVIGFLLYTRENPTEPQPLINDDPYSILDSNFNPCKPTKFYFHGWTAQPSNPSLVNAFLNVSDVNIIMVNWTLAGEGEESVVVARVPDMGKYIASFVDFLHKFGLAYENIHFVAMSLGCHVSGFTGRNMKQVPEYITACDPPKRFWEDNEERINPGDAKYVEVIHTNTAYHGLILPTGHTDFYPNGGGEMPGCEDNPNCSHARSIQYFVDSIDHELFQSIECTDYEELVEGNCANLTQLYMGGMKPKYKTGVFYLETNAEQPFYKG